MPQLSSGIGSEEEYRSPASRYELTFPGVGANLAGEGVVSQMSRCTSPPLQYAASTERCTPKTPQVCEGAVQIWFYTSTRL